MLKCKILVLRKVYHIMKRDKDFCPISGSTDLKMTRQWSPWYQYSSDTIVAAQGNMLEKFLSYHITTPMFSTNCVESIYEFSTKIGLIWNRLTFNLFLLSFRVIQYDIIQYWQRLLFILESMKWRKTLYKL